MTTYGKLNLAGMFLLPVVATISALIFFGPLPPTLVSVFVINLIPMLISGAVAGLLILAARRRDPRAAAIATWPTIIPAVLGALGYLWYIIRPREVGPQAEHLAIPQYVLVGVLVLCLIAAIGVLTRRRSG